MIILYIYEIFVRNSCVNLHVIVRFLSSAGIVCPPEFSYARPCGYQRALPAVGREGVMLLVLSPCQRAAGAHWTSSHHSAAHTSQRQSHTRSARCRCAGIIQELPPQWHSSSRRRTASCPGLSKRPRGGKRCRQ